MVTASRSDVGVVGLGEAGRRYASIAQDLGCSVVGTDANANKCNRAERTLNIETYDDFEPMYDSDIDAVVIATPNRFHETAAIPALEEDLDIFFEKPLAHDFESAEQIVDAANSSESVCMVGYYLPFYECVETTKSYLEDGYFGDVTHIEARWVQRRAVPRRGSWYTSKDIAGGGVLQDKGSFLLHLLSHFGYPLQSIESVEGKIRSEFGKRDDYTSTSMWGGEGHENIFDVEDSVSAFINFEDGKTATIETAWAANTDSDVSLRIRGLDGGAHLDIGTGELTLYGVRRDRGEALTTTEVQPNYEDSVFDADSDGPTTAVFRERAFWEFLACRDRGEQPQHSNLSQALAVQRAIEDLYTAVDDSEL
jgi:predicted dehydrogenase